MCKNRDFLSFSIAYMRLSAQQETIINASISNTCYVDRKNFKSLASTSFATLAMSDFNTLAKLIWEGLHNGKIVVQIMFANCSMLHYPRGDADERDG